MTSLDDLDRRILTMMQRDCTTKAEAIAEAVGLSASAVQRRLKRLRAEGVIEAEIAVINRKLVDKQMTFVVSLEIERENYPALTRFRRWAEDEDQIQQAYYVTGSMDLILVVTAPDVEAFDALASRIMAHHPQIRRMNTNVVLGLLKLGLFVPAEGGA